MVEDANNDNNTYVTAVKPIDVCRPAVTSNLTLYDTPALQLDEDGNWLRPEYPQYEAELAPAKPCLTYSFGEGFVEILPSEKPNRRICFTESVHVMDIESNHQMLLLDEQLEDDDDDDFSFAQESSEDSQTDDGDYYLETSNGDLIYVYETDDTSERDESDDSSIVQEDRLAKTPVHQLDIAGMIATNLNLNDLSMIGHEGRSSGPKKEQEMTSIPKEDKENIQTSRKEGDVFITNQRFPSSPIVKKPRRNSNTSPAA